MAPSKPEIILFDYQYAPNAQKARNLLHLTGLPYRICEQPFAQPRPILQNLGITYRRIPVNAIGKDIYVDNRVFLDAVLTIFGKENGVQGLVKGKADHAYEAFGYRMFWNILEILPDAVYVPEMISDRKDLYKSLQRSDYREVRPAALAAFRQFLDIIENDFLADSSEAEPWINGANPGVADMHVVWIPKFALETLKYAEDASLAMGKEAYPRLHRWLAGFPEHVPDNQPELLDGDEASKRVLGMGYAAVDVGIDGSDPTGLKAGQDVQVGTMDDAEPGNMMQHGKLVGLSRREIVLELENGLRVHFPRIGYSITAKK